MRSGAEWLLWRSGILALARRVLVRQGRFVLVFHGVGRQRLPGAPRDVQPWFTVDELHQVLVWLQAHSFAFLTPTDFFETIKPGILLTFDDGHANNYHNVLPVLETFEAPAVLFVSTQHVVEPGNWLPASRKQAMQYWGETGAVPDSIARDFYDGLGRAELAACARHPLITIGGHTISHPFLTSLDDQTLQSEVSVSKQLTEEVIERSVDLFAYPTGDYDRRVAEAVRSAGYEAAFALDPIPVGMPLYEIPRIGLYQHDPMYLALKLSGLYRRPLDVDRR